MRIPDAKIDEISDKLNIVDTISEYVTLSKKGSRYWGLCPFHTEKTPSFSIDADKGLFYCFGCGKGGGLFQFIMEIEKLSFPEAARFLAKKAGVPIDSARESPETLKKEALVELYTRVAGSFHYLLKKKEEAEFARKYLRSRKISTEVMNAFELGYAPRDGAWLFRFLRKHKYSEEFLANSGLFQKNNSRRAFFRDRLIFPIKNKSGGVIAFGGRLLRGDGPKYLNSSESLIFSKRKTVFGLDQALPSIRSEGLFVLVEGYMDVLALVEAGLRNTIAPLGTSFTEDQALLLRRYAGNAVLMFDGDNAGKSAAKKAAVTLEKIGIDCDAVAMNPGEDPADVLEKESAQELKNKVNSSINIIEYLVDWLVSLRNSETPEGKEFVLQELFPYIDLMTSEVKREAALGLIADRLGVKQRSVLQDYTRRQRKTSSGEDSEVIGKNQRKTDDIFLMLAVIANREHFAYVRSVIRPEDLEDEAAREIFIALEECFRREEASTDALLSRISNQNLKDEIIRRITSGEFKENIDRAIQESVQKIKMKSLLKKREYIERSLRSKNLYESPEGGHKLRTLLEDKMYLDKELEKLRVSHDNRIAD